MYRLIVLGAGFSRPAGLPLGPELFSEIVQEAKRETYFENILKPDMERYLRFLERTTGETKSFDSMELEPFMAFLDVEHALGFRGSDTFSDDGNRSQLLIRFLISRILWWKQKGMSKTERELYDDFAARLEPGDWILTFNYDTIVEDALTRLRKPFRLVPARYKSVDAFSATYADEPETEVVLLKLHGSIDWFRKDHFQRNWTYRRRAGLTDRPRDAVFNNSRARPRKLVNGPYWRGSPLKSTYRVLDLDAFFEKAIPLFDTPLLVSPSYAKPLYLKPLADFWRDMGSAGSGNGTLAIVGYSLPSYDDYVRQALYAAVRNFQHFDTGDIIHKTNIRMVDLRSTEAEQAAYRSVYRFVDWSRADICFTGLTHEAIEMIFAA